MLVICIALGTSIMALAYYMMLLYLNKQLDLGLEQKNGVIASKYFWVTLAGMLLVWIYIGVRTEIYANIFALLRTAVIMWGMAVLSVTDYKKHIIPNRFLLLLIILWAMISGIGVIVDVSTGIAAFGQALIGGIAGGLIFLLCYILSRGQLGAGDVKCVFVLGLYMTGQRIVGSLMYGILLCFVYSVVQLLRKKIGMKDGVPLMPFMYAGTLISLIIL